MLFPFVEIFGQESIQRRFFKFIIVVLFMSLRLIRASVCSDFSIKCLGLKNARERLSRVCGSTSSSVCPFLRQCAPAETLTIVFAAKFFLLNNLRVALCRVMCGTVKEGLYCFT